VFAAVISGSVNPLIRPLNDIRAVDDLGGAFVIVNPERCLADVVAVDEGARLAAEGVDATAIVQEHHRALDAVGTDPVVSC
jgi:hypothetical protein